MVDTSIRVSERLADELHDRKQRGDSYEDVIWRLIQRADGTPRPPTDELLEDSDPYEDINAAVVNLLEESDERIPMHAVLDYVGDDIDIKPKNWWKTHGKPAIKDAGADYVHNKGWTIE